MHIHPCVNYQLLTLPCLFLLIIIYSSCRLLLWCLLLPTLNLVCLYNILESVFSLPLNALILPVYLPVLVIWMSYHVLPILLYSSRLLEMLLFPRSGIMCVLPVLSYLIMGFSCTKLLQISHTSCPLTAITSSLWIVDCAAILPLVFFDEYSCFI